MTSGARAVRAEPEECVPVRAETTAKTRAIPNPLRRSAFRVLVAALLAAAVTVPALGRDAPPVRDLRQAAEGRLPAPGLVAYLGVQFERRDEPLVVGRVVPGSAADFAGLKTGDVVVAIGGDPVGDDGAFDQVLASRSPGETVSLDVRRGGASVTLRARLSGRRPRDGVFRGSRFRLAVVPLRFAGETEPVPDPQALHAKLLATTGRRGRGATLADYFAEQSHGRFVVEGRILPSVDLPSTRAHYGDMPMGAPEGSAFDDAARRLETLVGESRLREFDGIAFLHGGRVERRAGFALWPHRATVSLGARRVPYYVHAVQDPASTTIGVHCHEFGHLLGLPDAYGAGHRTGAGDFCLMAIGHRGGPEDGATSPFSLCAWCRLRLAWVEPRVLDPREPQRIRIRPAGDARDQVAVVPLNSRSDEHLLLEVRARRGFDAELPSAGLLVWRVGGRPTPGQGIYGSHVDLLEAHGIDVFDASLVRPDEAAFPTQRARDLTPATTPHVRPTLRAGFEVHLTDIVREADGAVVVTIGVAAAVSQTAPAATADEVPDPEGFVERIDPVTGETTRFHVGPLGPGSRPPVPPTSATGQEQR